MTLDPLDGDLDGVEDPESLAEQADANRPYSRVTAEDLGTDEAIADEADPAIAFYNDDPSDEGVTPLDVDIEVERDEHETIEDRILQEEPDPASAIVPPDAGR